MRFGRKDPADTLGGAVKRREGGKRLAAADLLACHAGGVVWKNGPEANRSWGAPSRDAAGKGVGGAIVFGAESFEALRACDTDVRFAHGKTIARFEQEW